MSNEDFIMFILKMARKFLVLDSATVLNSLGEIYGINPQIVNYVSDSKNFEAIENPKNNKNEKT